VTYDRRSLTTLHKKGKFKSEKESTKTAKQSTESARRAGAWLAQQLAADGGWKALPDAPADAFYKVGMALSLTGQATAAERMSDYVKATLLQPDGDFLPRGHSWHTDVHYQYANGWFIIGAQKQGR
jgi:hypothetical protein